MATNPLPVPPGPVVQGTLVIGPEAGGGIPPNFIGLSYEKSAITYSYFHPSNRNLIALFRRLGVGVLRIGGGSVDEVQFVSTGKGSHVQVTAEDIKGLAGFLQATGWLCLYGVNFAASTPALAAEEAALVFSMLGPMLLGIEIGNEPDEYASSGHFFVGSWSFQEFFARWESFRTAIVAAAPGIPMTGPAAGGGNHIATWTLPFGRSATPNQISLLTQHYYRASGKSPIATAAFLITPDPQLAGDLTTLSAGAQQLGLPFRISECNSFYDGGAIGVSDSYASSLWVIDFLFDVASSGATGVNIHGGGNTPGYTPIADDSGGVIEARPQYYGMLLFSMAGAGNLLGIELSAGDADATAYAIKAPDGAINVIVVNKDTSQNLTITIEANQTIKSASLQLMTGPSLAATTGVTIQNASVNKDGSFSPSGPQTLTPSATQTTCYIPALSAALISII